jgi:hypothetical protein
VPAGWDLTSAACNNGDSPDSINLSAGEAVVCTFTNTRLLRLYLPIIIRGQ